MALTRYSPTSVPVIAFLPSISTRSVELTFRALASSITPLTAVPPGCARLLLSRFSDLRVLFFRSASPKASAAFIPRLFPSSSSFCKPLLTSSIPAMATPSSSPNPLRLRLRERHDLLSVRLLANRRTCAGFSSMPQAVTSGRLELVLRASSNCSNPPSAFFLISSSSRFFRANSASRLILSCWAFFCSFTRCRCAATSASFSFFWSSASFFFLWS
mmetsp:Transcript_51361/g.133642  ORF Transcript_51361/g.133642 Transcript_51361/m.133642 type:complete len:216 (+) Transcript_51361:453-1100(+)